MTENTMSGPVTLTICFQNLRFNKPLKGFAYFTLTFVNYYEVIMIDLTNSPLFPPIDKQLLTGKTMTSPSLANKPLRVVIDTDLDNEVDDFFALAHLAMAHHDNTIVIEAIYAAPYSFRTRLLEMLQAMELQKLKNPSPQEQAVINAYAGQIANIQAQGD
ncbi:MAG: hypothetical protein ACI8WB_006222 [Phenylobacterium sp.]|jgi:hypothetical protein